jgi:tetratricopeptide (TPR) repeat protein
MEHRPGSGRFDLRWLGWVALGGLLLAAPAGLAGCNGKRGSGASGGTSGAGTDRQAAATAADWAWLQQAKKALDAEREQLAGAKAVPADPKTAAPETALEKDVTARAEELNRRLVDFINASPPVEGEKPVGRLLEALRLKSDEDIRLARTYIEQSGDYRRAIEIYEAALAVDPENPRLQQELKSARTHRYMTAERFAQVKKGMTQDEVRSLLGQPNLRDIRDFPDRGISAWFYTKDVDGRAAAVWFAKGQVYMADFNAIEAARADPRS